MSKGEFYKGKVKPDVISWFEENLGNFWSYINNLSTQAAPYLVQTCPVLMNCIQTIGTVMADADFIPSNSLNGVPTGLIALDVSRLQQATLILIGRAVNNFGGTNYLDCSTATWNQWRINVDGGLYTDLQNGAKADGQMRSNDWYCFSQGVIHPFTLMFDITGVITDTTNRIGIRLADAVSIGSSLLVTVDIFTKYTWKL